MKLYMPIVFLALLLSGCGVQVVPRASAQISLDADKKTVTATENGLTLSVKVQDLDFGPYTGENNITAFYVKLTNNSQEERTAPLAAFMLFDQDRKVYRPLESERVTALTRQEANYLIPYPYVGFYYLQDSTDFDYSTQSASSLGYSPQRTSASVEAYALPVGSIPSGAHIAGMLFFNIDLYEKKFVDLTFQLPGEGNVSETNFSFRFDVVK
jgi:hypothetical protein